MTVKVENPADAMRMLTQAKMRPFTQSDWYGFAGCETKDPLIGEVGKFVIVLDGAFLNIIHEDDEYGGTSFELKGF